MLHDIYLSVDDPAEVEIGRRSSSRLLNSSFWFPAPTILFSSTLLMFQADWAIIRAEIPPNGFRVDFRIS
jgi:hypothetical protein